MNKLPFHISGFKCFSDCFLELNKLTLLTGSNASGKSSVIQALLMMKQSSESDVATAVVRLDDQRYSFDFGSPDSLINNELDNDEVVMAFEDGVGITFHGENQVQSRRLLVGINHLDRLKEIFAGGVCYFCAERQGPRYEYMRRLDDVSQCGCRGENTGNVIAANWNTKTSGNRLLQPMEENVLFNIALDNWVDYIFPGITVRIQPVGAQSYQVIIRDAYHNFPTDSTNIGFGISYALPILVGALLAKKGEWLVVENPEAHLHAKAQSNMGYFLGLMAVTGLRVIVETHSEHVVNGIRRASILDGRLRPDDVNIYFFKGKSEVTLITMDEDGNLSDFPVDFFDQVRQDMMEIIKSKRD